jgi:hypothetical protein
LAKPLKIVQLNLQAVVAAGINAGKNPQQIAEDCSAAANQKISHMAVVRYLEATGGKAGAIRAAKEAEKHRLAFDPKRPKRPASLEVRREQSHKVARILDRDIDLIELQYQTTQTLAGRFDWILDLPDIVEARFQQLADELRDGGVDLDYTAMSQWAAGFAEDIRRNVSTLATLNRELRENSKFIAELREKAFEFNLIQEYLFLFLDAFRRAEAEIHGSSAAFEWAEQHIAANPRMQRIVEQQRELRGYAEG